MWSPTAARFDRVRAATRASARVWPQKIRGDAVHSWMLTTATLVIPLLWSVIAHWLLDAMWPGRDRTAPERKPSPATEPLDFQI